MLTFLHIGLVWFIISLVGLYFVPYNGPVVLFLLFSYNKFEIWWLNQSSTVSFTQYAHIVYGNKTYNLDMSDRNISNVALYYFEDFLESILKITAFQITVVDIVRRTINESTSSKLC